MVARLALSVYGQGGQGGRSGSAVSAADQANSFLGLVHARLASSGQLLACQPIAFQHHSADLALILALLEHRCLIHETLLEASGRVHNDHLEGGVADIAIGVKDVARPINAVASDTQNFLVLNLDLGGA